MPILSNQATRIAPAAGFPAGVDDIWNLLPSGLGTLNQKMQLALWNDSMQRLSGLPEQQLAGMDFFTLLNIDLQQRTLMLNELAIHDCWQGIIHNKQQALRVDIQRKQINSETVFPFVITDYSKDYNTLTELSAAKILAEKTDKAKSQFLSHMSHELRTPLNAILGFAQLMQANEDLSDIQQDNLKEIEDAGSCLLNLINEILDLSRIEAGKIQLSEESISLDQLIHEGIKLVKPMAEKKRVSITYELNTSKLLQSDHVRLKQVLLNLLSNAVKYNRDGGSVSAHCIEIDDNTIRIEIRDSGPGIKHELQNSIFSPFERMGADNKKTEGSGIGLMITRRLVQLMGGRIGLLSEPDRGSVFWMELPSAQAKLDNVYNMGNSQSQPDRSNLTLVCIGMDATQRDLINRTMSLRAHINLEHYPNVHEAVFQLLQYKPQCIFLGPEAAYELSMDPRNLLTLKNLNLVVVENTSNPASPRVDQTLFSKVLPQQHTLHELLALVDSYFSEK